MISTIFAVLQGSVTLYVLFMRIWPILNFGQTDDGNNDQQSKRREKKLRKSKSPRKGNPDSRECRKKRAPTALSRAMLFATVRDTDNFVPTGRSLASVVCDEIECVEVNLERLNEEHEVEFEEENLTIVISAEDEPELGNASQSVEKLSAEEEEVEQEDEVEDSEKFFQEEEDINCDQLSSVESAGSVESEEIGLGNSQDEEEANRHHLASVESAVSVESEEIRLDDFTPEEDAYYKSLEVISDESTAAVTEAVDAEDPPVDEVRISPLHRAAVQEYSRTCVENLKEGADDHSTQESGDGCSQYWGL